MEDLSTNIQPESKSDLELALKNGLILSSVTVAVTLITSLITLPSTASMLLGLTKTIGSIYILYRMMKAYSADKAAVSYGKSFKYGMKICFLSSIVCTLINLVSLYYINPGILDQLVEQAFLQIEAMGMSDQLDYNTMSSIIYKIMPISSFINCIISGLLFSLIIASFTKKVENIF